MAEPAREMNLFSSGYPVTGLGYPTRTQPDRRDRQIMLAGFDMKIYIQHIAVPKLMLDLPHTEVKQNRKPSFRRGFSYCRASKMVYNDTTSDARILGRCPDVAKV